MVAVIIDAIGTLRIVPQKLGKELENWEIEEPMESIQIT